MPESHRRPPVTRILSASETPPSRRVPTYALTVESPPAAPRRLVVAQPLYRVGSRPECDLALEDPTVSRLHLELALDEHGVRLKDLGSRNGTFVDGVRALDLYLVPGAKVQLGKTRLVYEPLAAEAELPLSRSEHFGPLVGRSLAMRELFAKLEAVAPTDATVLIEGESGVGKELVAEAVHRASRRARGPLVVFDCAAAPANLLESELFGHERGAFTGAGERRTGLFEEADGGTLFVDEVGELPLELQPKLLRALEKREVRRLGATRPQKVDARIVAATNRDLAREVNGGAFREDLYYRLAVVRLVVPPLRERPEDIEPLVREFVRLAVGGDGDRRDAILDAMDPSDWQALKSYPYPGNVRELRNIVERSLALGGERPIITVEPKIGGAPRLVESEVREVAVAVDLERPYREQKQALVRGFERAYLLGLLERHGGNISHAAEAAGMDRMYFKRLLKRYR